MFKPLNPSVKVRMRYAATTNTNGTYAGICLNIGADIVGLTDFTNWANTFARFTITRASLVVFPTVLIVTEIGATNAFGVDNYQAIAVGYFND